MARNFGGGLRRALAPLRLHHLEQEPGHLLAFLVLGAVFSVAGAVGIAGVAGYGAVAHHLRHPNYGWLPIALAGAVATHLGYVLGYREVVAVDEGARLSLLRTSALVTTGFGIFVPRGGFALDLEAMRDLGIPASEARARVLGLGALEYAVLAYAAWVCAILLLFGHSSAEQAVTVPWAIGVPAGTVLALVGYGPAARYLPRALARRLESTFRAIDMVIMILARPRRHGLRALLGMGLYWSGEMFVLWSCLAVFNGRGPSIPEAVVGYATGYALTRRTLPLAGAGAVEAALPLALMWVGFGLAPAVLAVFAYRIFNVWLPVIPALAGLEALRRRQPPHRLPPDAEVGGDDRDAETAVRPRRGRRVHR